MNLNRISRLIGAFWMLTSLVWALLAVWALVAGLRGLNNLQAQAAANLSSVDGSLDAIHALIVESTQVVTATSASLTSVQAAIHDSSTALNESRPLLWQTTKLVTIQIPEALDGIQDSMPTVIATAQSVDQTLTWLSSFRFTIPNPFGPDWTYDLGITYAPEVPLDEALALMNANLENMPADLRAMKESLNTSDQNLILISDDLALLAGDLETVNQQLTDLNPHLQSLAQNVAQIQESFRTAQEGLPNGFAGARWTLSLVLGLVILSQIPAGYMGWLLLRGERPKITDQTQ